MKIRLYCYLAILLCLLICDALWLGFIAKDSYQQAMGHIMREQVIIWPWVLFYLSYPMAILYLAVSPDNPHSKAWLNGAILGATAYGTYNLTNYSLIAGWPLSITLIDWGWGIVLTSIGASVGSMLWLKIRPLV